MNHAEIESRTRIVHVFCAVIAAVLLAGVPTSAPEASASEFPVADLVIVEKSKRKLHLVKDGETFRTFRIALGIRPVGDKTREGDFRTPEGRYLLDSRNPNSEYFLSIHVSYPNQA
ncbi:MAG: L,D-transpeptidase family protein, partial [Woeseiaceae bacterium]|nr:L,D-transpeptidase family protein [Woeseiaceae bacterium]